MCIRDRTETAEGLERREIGILDAMELRESSRRAGDEHTIVLHPIRDGASNDLSLAWRCVHEKDAIAGLRGKHAPEVRVRHQQLALQDAVAQRADETHRCWLSSEDEIFAERTMEYVRHR